MKYRAPQTLLPLPSYDLWEERYALHAYTVASVIAGLRAAANFANLFQDTALAGTQDQLQATLPYLEWCKKTRDLPAYLLNKSIL